MFFWTHMRLYSLLLLLASSIALNNCAILPNPDKQANDRGNSLVTIEKSANHRPDWIDSIPEDSAGRHFLVGLSNYHASEQIARQDAMQNARLAFARYTGVNIKDLDSVLKALYGNSRDILDATVMEHNYLTEQVEAPVSRVKAKQWYWEKYRQAGQDKSQHAYKYWVLVTVPHSEYDRIQAWKAEQRQRAQQARNEQEKSARSYFTQVMQKHRQNIQQIETLTGQDKILHALRNAKAAWNQLYQAQQVTQSKIHLPAPKILQLQQAQEDVLKLIGRIRDGIVLDTGRNAVRYAVTEPTEVPVWVWFKSDQSLQALPNIPLVLKDSLGNIVARATSGKDGSARFHPPLLEPGDYQVSIDIDANRLTGLDYTLKRSLGSVNQLLSVVPVKDTPGYPAYLAVQSLFDMPGATTTETQRLVLQQPSGKNAANLDPRESRTIEHALKSALAQITSLELEHKPNKADLLLSATISLQGRQPVLELRLKKARGQELLASSEADLRHADLRSGTAGIEVELTSRFGDNQTFQEGDLLSWYISFDKPAYLLLVYQDAAGNLIQIYPAAGQNPAPLAAADYLELPGKLLDIDLRVSSPFGQETLWAFAASAPFPKQAGQDTASGLRLLRENRIQSLAHRLQQHAKSRSAAFGKASTTITTVARPAAMDSYAG